MNPATLTIMPAGSTGDFDRDLSIVNGLVARVLDSGLADAGVAVEWAAQITIPHGRKVPQWLDPIAGRVLLSRVARRVRREVARLPVCHSLGLNYEADDATPEQRARVQNRLIPTLEKQTDRFVTRAYALPRFGLDGSIGDPLGAAAEAYLLGLGRAGPSAYFRTDAQPDLSGVAAWARALGLEVEPYVSGLVAGKYGLVGVQRLREQRVRFGELGFSRAVAWVDIKHPNAAPAMADVLEAWGGA